MEGIGVLHRELTHADQAGARACLIAELGLDLVDHERILGIALAIFAHKLHGRFLVRHAKHKRATVAVRKAHQLTADALIPAGFLPQGSGHHHRKLHFLAVDGIHLLADDGLDFARDAPKRHI